MAITKSTNKIQFIKANKAAYQDIKATYPHCIFFAIDDKCIIVDDVEYGLGSADLADTLKKLVTDITISGNNTITLLDAESNTVGTPITINDASSAQAGLMSAADKAKFDSFFGGTGEGISLDEIWDMIGEKGSDSKVDATTLWGGIDEVQDELLAFINTKGQHSGLAELDENGVVPSNQLPSYVDDVVEVATEAALPETGESGKIYITADTNLIFRWVKDSAKYVEIPRTSAESITRLNKIQTKEGVVDEEYSIEKGVQEANAYTDNSLSWYEDDQN
ncbi:hypothetical protein [Intestinibacter sp.]|uniref:hypothetical protein n=1 Tax=Intestinibacter sp. TaxID=1965304 RepID=UPI003F190334